MDKRLQPLEIGAARQALAEKILNCLDVVVGAGLQCLDPLGVRHAELVHQCVDQIVRRPG